MFLVPYSRKYQCCMLKFRMLCAANRLSEKSTKNFYQCNNETESESFIDVMCTLSVRFINEIRCKDYFKGMN